MSASNNHIEISKYELSIRTHDITLISKVRQVKLFFVHWGRNAWHSTWTDSYSNYSFFINLDAAKDFCEKNRCQGTSFRILQIPALAIYTKDKLICVIEINTITPMADFNLKSFSSQEQVIVKNNGKKTCAIDFFIKSVSPSSTFWLKQKRALNSVISLKINKIDCDLENIVDDCFSQYIPHSVGSGYFFQWHEAPYAIDRTNIMYLFRLFKPKKISNKKLVWDGFQPPHN